MHLLDGRSIKGCSTKLVVFEDEILDGWVVLTHGQLKDSD